MAKASITKKTSINAEGILYIEDGKVSVEVAETGELLNLAELFEDFNGKSSKISINYSEDF